MAKAKKGKKSVKAPKKGTKKTEKKPEPKMTLKEKIDRTVEDYKDNPEELKKQMYGLVQRVLYPDQFCPECNDRLFFSGQTYDCPNCGYKRNVGTPAPVTNPRQSGKVPKVVEETIQQAEQSMEEPRRVAAPTKRGQKIKKLVDQMDTGGPSAPTPQDEAAVRRDKNVGHKITWV